MDAENNGINFVCDVCGNKYIHDDRLHDIVKNWTYLWHGRRDKYEIPDCCHECAPKKDGLVKALIDILELETSINKFRKAINDKRKQRTKNYRPAKNNACQCCKRGT